MKHSVTVVRFVDGLIISSSSSTHIRIGLFYERSERMSSQEMAETIRDFKVWCQFITLQKTAV